MVVLELPNQYLLDHYVYKLVGVILYSNGKSVRNLRH